MGNREGWPSYSELLECLGVLRGRIMGRPLAYLIGLVGGYIMEADLRQMLNYLMRKGTLSRRGKGTDAEYVLKTPRNRGRIAELKIEKSGRPWNNSWSVFTYDIPTTQNSLRTRLARWLHEMGFAALGRSSWVSPYDWSDFVRGALAEWHCQGRFHYLQSASVAPLFEHDQPGLNELWEIQEVGAGYRHIARRCAGAPSGVRPAQQRSRARILVAARMELRSLEKSDPMLPAQLLPSDWSREEALRAMEALRARVEKDVEGATARGAIRGQSR